MRSQFARVEIIFILLNKIAIKLHLFLLIRVLWLVIPPCLAHVNLFSKMSRELPENWIKKESRSHPGKSYYFNTKTNESSWKFPVLLEKSKQHKLNLIKNASSRSTLNNEYNSGKRIKLWFDSKGRESFLFLSLSLSLKVTLLKTLPLIEWNNFNHHWR